jgi:hypothetical protein
MYGSDQMLWPEAITRGIDAINSAPFLTAAQKRDIQYNTTMPRASSASPSTAIGVAV